MSWWPYWTRPGWLLLLPLLAWLLWRLWHRQRQSGRWHGLLPPAFHAALLRGGRRRSSKGPWILLGVGWGIAWLALLGPSWARDEAARFKPVDPMVVVLDLSSDMLATDLPPTRLEHAKRKLLDLLQAREDSQTAVVVYAGSAHVLVPLSDDIATLRNLLGAVKPSIMPEPGRRADLAISKAIELLDGGANGHGSLLLMTSELDDVERQGLSDVLDAHPARLAILGFGTAEGAPIALDQGGYLRSPDGAIRIPRLEAERLADTAHAVGGEYLRASLDGRDLQQLKSFMGPPSTRALADPRQLNSWREQGYWLLLPLLALAACAGRRGWLFCLPFLAGTLLPRPALALDWADLWWRHDQQAHQQLRENRPEQAAELFEDPRWQGLALYEAGRYADAIDRFARGETAADRYNLGNALARNGQLEAAIDAYDQALSMMPGLQDARDNKALVERLLRQRQSSGSGATDSPPQDSTSQQAENNEQDGGKPPAPPTAPPEPGSEPGAADNESGQASSPPAGTQEAVPDEQAGDGSRTPQTSITMDGERRQALEQWLRQIPDDPAELLKRKFWYEQQQRQETAP